MFRATVDEQDEGTRVKLEGSLSGPYVQELQKCWEGLQRRSLSKAAVVDLESVTFVNAAGKELLAQMCASGAKLIGRGPMTRSIVEEIVATCSTSKINTGR